MSFKTVLNKYSWDDVKNIIYSTTSQDVEKILIKTKIDLFDFAALLSPAAENFLEPMAQIAHNITVQRFGKTIKLYAPLYLSNECTNSCIYCGFNKTNEIPRITLNELEIEKEAKAIFDTGIRHILLLTGESPKHANIDYLKKAVNICKKYFSSVAIEVYPLTIEEYEELYKTGVDSLTIYQETYNKDTYKKVHIAGKKSDFEWRLETPERGCKAGLRYVGIGALMGLNDFRIEEFFVGLHASYLMKNFWKTHIGISFPRIRKAEGNFTPKMIVTDKNLVQSMLALRIFLNDVGLVISTREPANLRNKLLPLGVTQMSAGSKTEPGGYTKQNTAGEQFEVEDKRNVTEFVNMLRQQGYDPVMKDWDISFLDKTTSIS
jgi:2-iminoacetate synthase